MQELSEKPEEAYNCYLSHFPYLVDGILTIIVLCAQAQPQLPLVECPHSAQLRAFCFQRHDALLVTNNALCLMSGLVSGVLGGTNFTSILKSLYLPISMN